MPDYGEDQLPEKEFFYCICTTLYPVEFSELIQVSYKARQQNNKTDESNMIELTKEMKEEIDKILCYKSK